MTLPRANTTEPVAGGVVAGETSGEGRELRARLFSMAVRDQQVGERRRDLGRENARGVATLMVAEVREGACAAVSLVAREDA